MFTASFIHTRVTFATALALVTLAASLFIFQIPQAQAEVSASGNTETSVTKSMTASDLQMLITKLQSQLRELTGALETTEPQFKPGMSVEVTDNLRIRGSASINGRFIGVQKPGVKGVVVEGPIKHGGYNWVKVDYESGPDGWNAAGWLKQRTSPSQPTETTFDATVSNLKATVSFTLSNGCGGYIISWGDDTKTEQAGSATGRPCTMAIVHVTKDHTYAKAGTYKIKVERFDGPTLKDVSTKEIKVSDDSKPAKPISTIIECVSGTIKYAEGAKLQTITENGGTRSIADASFVCKNKDGKGVWVVEGSLPKPIATTTTGVLRCVSGVTKYEEGAKLQVVTVNGETKRVSDGSYVCRSGKWVVEGSLPRPATTTATYSNLDVLSVTKQVVAGSRMVADSGYTLYTITLKTGRKIEVKVFGLMTSSMVEAEFRKTGFAGSVTNLLAQATVVSTATPSGTGGSASTTTQSGYVRGASTDILTEISVTLNTIGKMIAELK